MHKKPRMSLRKRNCHKIAQAFFDHIHSDLTPTIWINWIDPLSKQSAQPRSHSKPGYHTFYCGGGRPVHVPLEWYWREIEDWELDSLVVEWRLSQA